MKKRLFSIMTAFALVAGAMTSCQKDWTEDFNNLDKKVNELSTQVSALKSAVDAGSVISSVVKTDKGLTITLSDGKTYDVTNGKDGVNGTNGENGAPGSVVTVGENGNWFIDGVDTELAAAGKDGVNGENGKDANVVYYVPGENGVFVKVTVTPEGEKTEEPTEISYIAKQEGAITAVLVDGVLTLYGVEGAENGELVLGAAATEEAAVLSSAAAPVSDLTVKFETATWVKSNFNVKTDDNAKALAAAFPELTEIKDQAIVKQGGHLPVVINPASVILTNDFKYSLVGLDGEVADIKVSNPVKGMNIDKDATGFYTKADNSCIWTLDIDPAFKKGAYVGVNNASLVVEDENGAVVRTAYAYTVAPDTVSADLIITSYNASVYAKTIDVFTAVKAGYQPIYELTNEYAGYFILSATNKLQVEKYGLSIDGSKLTIGNMPEKEQSITISLNLIALGMNGKPAAAPVDVVIAKTVDASETLEAKDVTLNADPTEAPVRWDMSELGLKTATEIDNLLNGTTVTAKVSRKVDGNDVVAFNGNVVFYNAKGEVTTYTSPAWNATTGEAVSFGFNVDAKNKMAGATEFFTADTYDVEITAIKGTTVLYSATSTLEVKNPTETVISLFPELIDANGVLQIVGSSDKTDITYDMTKGIKKSDNVTITKVEDLDATDGDNWISGTTLTIPVYSYTDKTKQKLYKERNFKATYTLFNSNNECEFEFQGVVISAIYSGTPESVITVDKTQSIKFSDKAAENTIAVKDFVKKAVYAAGPNRGKEYKLFMTAGSAGSAATTKNVTIPDHNEPPMTIGDYVMATDGTSLVEVTQQKYIIDFGFDDGNYDPNKTYYLTTAAWESGATIVKKYYTVNADKNGLCATPVKANKVMAWKVKADGSFNTSKTVFEVKINNDNKYEYKNSDGDWTLVSEVTDYLGKTGYTDAGYSVEDEIDVKGTPFEKEVVEFYLAYYKKIKFKTTTKKVEVPKEDSTPDVIAAGLAGDPTFEFVDKVKAAKYVDSTTIGSSITAKSTIPEDIPAGKVTLDIKMTVTDVWGMKMEIVFPLAITTK